MFENIEKLKLLDVVEGVSARRGEYTDRFSHAFVCKLSGESTYDFGSRILSLRAGEVLFIPKGASYTVRQTSPGESRYLLMNFDGEIAGAVPRICSLEGFTDAGLIRKDFAQLWLLGGQAERYRCISVFYNVLSLLTRMEGARYADAGRLGVIRPAVDYLREHLFDSALRPGELHRLCGVSDTYFRRIFKANFGVGPQEYVTNKRLAQAAAIISGGDFDSIQQVALSVGFSDPLYFSRMFARRYGSSPSNYKRKTK